jgi:HAE1 family hydrophobic/amphiphilic exporter-1
VLVIFLFLKNLPATVIPSLALPFSIVGTFAVMSRLGYNLDNLSLMALTLSVGFVVDDAIVMLENIHRHMELGKPPLQAALDGSREIGFTILSMTLSLVAVFIPVLFMGGLLGRLFHEFAVTISAAILVSGVVSLTLTPMLCSRFLKPEHSQQHGRAYQLFERGYQATLGYYTRTLEVGDGPPAHRAAVLGADPGRHRGAVPHRAEGLHPERGHRPDLRLDRGAGGHVVRRDGQAPAGGCRHRCQGSECAGLHVERRRWRRRHGEHRPRVHPLEAAQAAQAFGRSGDRGAPAQAVARARHSRLSQQSRRSSTSAGARRRASTSTPLQSTDTGTLYDAAGVLVDRLQKEPELQDVTSDLQIRNPQVQVQIDRERAASLGVTPFQIEQALYQAYGSAQVSTIFTPNDQYWVIHGAAAPVPARRIGAVDPVDPLVEGNLVPLGAVATLTPSVGPLSVNHAGQIPSRDRVVQSAARRVARRGHGLRSSAAARQVLPSNVSTELLRHGAGVPVQPAGSCCGCCCSRCSSSTSCSVCCTRASSTR